MTMKIEFNEQELNLILSSLAQLPYIKSAQLISKIQKSANEVNEETEE